MARLRHPCAISECTRSHGQRSTAELEPRDAHFQSWCMQLHQCRSHSISRQTARNPTDIHRRRSRTNRTALRIHRTSMRASRIPSRTPRTKRLAQSVACNSVFTPGKKARVPMRANRAASHSRPRRWKNHRIAIQKKRAPSFAPRTPIKIYSKRCNSHRSPSNSAHIPSHPAHSQSHSAPIPSHAAQAGLSLQKPVPEQASAPGLLRHRGNGEDRRVE
jgi:hypothetical protein